jgi:hypothetical protein
MSQSGRPRLRRGLEITIEADGHARLGMRITALRRCDVTLSTRQIAIASLFDGRYSMARIAAVFARHGELDVAAAALALARQLRRRGFLAHDRAAEPRVTSLLRRIEGSLTTSARLTFRRAVARAASSLAVLREIAFLAFDRRDASLARDVARLLHPFAGNAAAVHLRMLVQNASAFVVVRKGRLSVVARPPSTTADAHEILQTAAHILSMIGALLRVRFAGHVIVDVATRHRGLPVTMVADGEPYTVVRISLCRYSRAVLCHELTHVLAMSAHRWLSEGLAIWVQRTLEPGRCFPDDAVDGEERGGVRKLGPPLAWSDHRATHPALERAEYLKAAALVTWLIERHGLGAFMRLFAASRDLASVTAACRALGFRSLEDVEDEWRRYA